MADGPALQRFIEQFVGGRFYVQTTLVTLQTTATKLVDHNFERMACSFTVLGTKDAYVMPALNPTTALGVILANGGGGLSLVANEDMALVGWEWYGVGSGGTTTVLVVEVIRFSEGQK